MFVNQGFPMAASDPYDNGHYDYDYGQTVKARACG
jgi:hypothetical protein